MKGLVFTACLLAVSFAHAKLVPYQTLEEAFKAVPVCVGPIAVDATRVARVSGPSQIYVDGIGNIEDFSIVARESAIDLKIKGNILYALTNTLIQEYDLTTKALLSSVKTIDTDITLQYGEYASGMDFHGNDLVISHNGMGYSIYDTVAHKVVDHVLTLQDQVKAESKLTSVVVVGDQAIFTVDQWTQSGNKPAFFGFLVVDLKTGKEVRRLAGPDVGSTMLVRKGDQLIVGYDIMPLHVFLLKDVLTAKKAPIKKIITSYGIDGFPIGHGVIVDSKLLTCFTSTPKPGTGGHIREVPMVLDTKIFRP